MEIDALIMAGGEGRRLKSPIEKPLVKILGKRLVDYVIEALQKSKINVIYAATSPKAPNTEKYLKEKGVTLIRTPGRGYVKDMVYALSFLGLGKTLVISADLPLIKAEDIDWLISEYKKHATPSLCLLVPAYIFEELDIEPSIVLEGNVPAGINIVDGKNLNGPETKLISNRIEFALNVNTEKELKLAERRLKMPISKELLEILACPIDKKDVEYKKDEDFLLCKKCDIRYYAERMKQNTCPKCGEEMEKIKGEVLVCVECNRWYPIIDDIPHMLPDELREDLAGQ